jgi:hypothetical protein
MYHEIYHNEFSQLIWALNFQFLPIVAGFIYGWLAAGWVVG